MKKRIKRIAKDIVRDSIRAVIPNIWYIKARFYLTHGYQLNLETPQSWNEKIQWRKLNCDNEYFSKFVDKLTVRDYVKETIGEEYLIPLLGYYDKVTPEDFDNLPDSFVIKTSNGNGGENVKVIWDKNKEDISRLCEQFNNYLKVKIGSKLDELYYDIQKPHIIIEKLLLDNDGNIPADYKLHTFYKEKEIYIQLDQGRFEKHVQDFYDKTWNKVNMKVAASNSKKITKKPKKFEKMKELAFKLTKEFNYLRVDFYNIDGKIYFGEMTFASWNGFVKVEPQEWDYKLGDMWELKN